MDRLRYARRLKRILMAMFVMEFVTAVLVFRQTHSKIFFFIMSIQFLLLYVYIRRAIYQNNRLRMRENYIPFNDGEGPQVVNLGGRSRTQPLTFEQVSRLPLYTVPSNTPGPPTNTPGPLNLHNSSSGLSKPKKVTEPDNSLNCAICFSGFAIGDSIRVLPCCHSYHMICIDE